MSKEAQLQSVFELMVSLLSNEDRDALSGIWFDLRDAKLDMGALGVSSQLLTLLQKMIDIVGTFPISKDGEL